MSSDSNKSSPFVEPTGRGAPSPTSNWKLAITKPKWLFVIVAAAWPFAFAFLNYLLPTFAYYLFFTGLACWIPLFLFSLGALFRRRWKAVTIFATAWVLTASPFLGVNEPIRWLNILGFRIHTFPLETYLARCSLYDFVEKGTRQVVGVCESTWTGPIEDTVFYDFSRQFGLPASQRTQGWKGAMSHFTDRGILAESDNRAHHLFGNFYVIGVNINEMTGG